MAKIFLLTHDPLLATAYTMRLRRAGYEVEHRSTAQTGLVKARQWVPDLILLDLCLPGMHGLQVLKLLRDVPWLVKVPVILLIERTAARDILDECLLWGAEGFLAKEHCSLQQLVEQVQALLRTNVPTAAHPAPGLSTS